MVLYSKRSPIGRSRDQRSRCVRRKTLSDAKNSARASLRRQPARGHGQPRRWACSRRACRSFPAVWAGVGPSSRSSLAPVAITGQRKRLSSGRRRCPTASLSARWAPRSPRTSRPSSRAPPQRPAPRPPPKPQRQPPQRQRRKRRQPVTRQRRRAAPRQWPATPHRRPRRSGRRSSRRLWRPRCRSTRRHWIRTSVGGSLPRTCRVRRRPSA
mmetsp:Transcript_61913/g.178210  ORF Transcript_61913/g.178210 Transcript_61913/m.178210 type:complete len:212 (-) Transcript_61913:201-836(-)